ncbi:MAG TPA: glycosyltransferase family 2 protein [Syntrophales bacterium]|nr:glycosyltransferase family 2 protein [Syntrophales bacterium]HOL60164.1 glycosyltransferase family 2 protein [Syntrophales bacterium]HPO36267.1 glycosyltransferase family 2 protein [Syntrophales bacterium]
MPKVSVIMGAYNCADTLRLAVYSIKSQSFSDWEFIICNDASTDNTWEVLSEIAQDDHRLILINNNKNLALGGTLNRCVEKASGEYLARQDADDYSLPERLQEQVKFLDEHPQISVAGSYAELFDSSGKVWGVNKPPLYPEMKDWLKGSCLIHPSVMMRRKDIEKVGYYDPTAIRVEDYELWLRMALAGYRMVTIPKILYRFHMDLSDYKRKRFSHRLHEVKIKYRIMKKLSLSPLYYGFLLKPLITGFIPRNLLYTYHYRKFRLS